MSFETAKRFIDYILSDEIRHSPAVIIEFIGGEPFLEVELIDRISDYFKKKAFELKHPWYWNYRFNFSTNGVNFSSEAVQRYLDKNEGKVSVGITIDGTRDKHDLQREFPDGSGSYDQIILSLPSYVARFAPSTKVTFASDDLIYLKDSILDLWEKGITEVAANVVFEDVWKEGDDRVLEEQLKALADHVLDHKLYDKYRCTFFDEGIGGYLMQDAFDKTSCGAGKMMAVGPEGHIYPCIRYKGYSLNNRKEWLVGDIENGVDMERVRPFIAAATRYQSDEECLDCPAANGCMHCQGFNYDCADVDTNFYRAKYICKMHKARIRANEYYFAQLWKRYGIRRERKVECRQLYIPLTDNYVSWCCYRNERTEETALLSGELLKQALGYCAENLMEAVLVHPVGRLLDINLPELYQIPSRHIVSAGDYREACEKYENVLPVFEKNTLDADTGHVRNCILNAENKELSSLAETVTALLKKADRINVNLHGLSREFDEELYRKQLLIIAKTLEENTAKEVNLITDRVYLTQPDNCKAGTHHFTMDCEGNIYPCIGLMESGTGGPAGSVKGGELCVKGERLYRQKNHPICQKCDAYQCRDCLYRNKTATGELCVSPSWQCRKAHVEREISRLYQQKTGVAGGGAIEAVDYTDPIVRLEEMKEENGIYYKY